MAQINSPEAMETPASDRKPLLFVDVDGVLSLFGPDLDIRSDGAWTRVDGIPHLLSERAGEHLRG
jgi:hypothetical protein